MAERKKITVLDPAHGGTEDRGGSSRQGGASVGPNSPELEKVIDCFFNFLEEGLTKE